MTRLDHERNNTRIRGAQAASEAERAPIDPLDARADRIVEQAGGEAKVYNTADYAGAVPGKTLSKKTIRFLAQLDRLEGLVNDAQQGKRRRSPPHQPRRQGGRR